MKSCFGAVVGFVALVLIGCEKKPTCPVPPDKAHAKTIDETAAAEAFKKDSTLCQELVNPKLTLTGDELTITSIGTRTITRRAEIPLDKAAHVPGVRDALASHRDALRFIRSEPAQRVDFDVDPKLESVRAINVIATANATDWPQMMVKTTDSVYMRWWSPAPAGDTIRKVLYIEALDAQQLIVRKPGGDCATPAVLRSAVGPAIVKLCEENTKLMKDQPDPHHTGRCIDDIELRVPATLPFGDTAQIVTMITATLAAQKSAAPIALLVKGMDFETRAPTEEMKRCAK